MELPEVTIPLSDFLYISYSMKQTGIQGDKIQRINQGKSFFPLEFLRDGNHYPGFLLPKQLTHFQLYPSTLLHFTDPRKTAILLDK